MPRKYSRELGKSMEKFVRFENLFSAFLINVNFILKGQVIDYNKLSNFIQGCSEISTFMNAYDNTDKPMSESVWKKWTDLYAAPNPLNFPNLASNFISSNVFKDRVYRFEVKTQLLDNPSACQLNAFNIKQSL